MKCLSIYSFWRYSEVESYTSTNSPTLKLGAYCTSSDGARVGSYSLPDASFNLDKLNCNCARDKQKYNYKINCLENGNYNPLQTTQSNGYYCVDDDGFPKTDMFDREVNCTEYY
ncbi:unnamed protein product [Acanthoscelides obtectus]|uniref:Thyroglobulin type-1 domain-containing protein n=1 Tax=Acanthoscelides obtectus TaxID=200917 RepID=A0A9P0LXG2_ACAOB|nr:unnamed protein product [Acanthoscelides obtectus]CAK1651795.1 hypothetical protein AOBTE_LOCUS17456 [Acanthoscelides obtectus]